LLHGQGAENLRAIANALDVGNSDFAIGVQEVDAYQDRSDQVFQVSDFIGTPGFKWR